MSLLFSFHSQHILLENKIKQKFSKSIRVTRLFEVKMESGSDPIEFQ